MKQPGPCDSNASFVANAPAGTPAPSQPQTPRRTPNRALTGLALALSIAGSGLIWYKLRVVTGVPRQAIADPEQRAPATDPARPSDADASMTHPTTEEPGMHAPARTTSASDDVLPAAPSTRDSAPPR